MRGKGIGANAGRVCRLMVLAGLPFGLSACAGFHLYDKGDDKLAADAVSSYGDSKVSEVIKTENANLDALEKREIEAFLKSNDAERDLMLLSLLSDSKKSFAERFGEVVAARLTEIVGKGNSLSFTENLQAVLARRQELETAAANEAHTRQQLVDMDPALAALPQCKRENESKFQTGSEAEAAAALGQTDYKFPPNIAAVIAPVFQRYVREQCKPLLRARDGLAKAYQPLAGGELETALKNRDAGRDGIALQQNELASAKAELAKALSAATAAGKAKDAAAGIDDLTCPPDHDQSAPPPNRLCKALAHLKKLGDGGLKAISEERLDKVNLALVALSGTATDADEKKMPAALVLLNTSARFSGAVKAYQAAGTYPALEPLLIEKQLQTARLAAAARGLALKKQQQDALNEQVEALKLEADQLTQISALLSNFGAPASCEKKAMSKKDVPYCLQMSQMFDENASSKVTLHNGEPAGRVAYRALAKFSETYSIARARQVRARLTQTLVSYRDAVNRSETSLAMWDGLIATPMNQLKSYYAGGFKPEEAAQWIQALGVVGIAERVK